MSYVFLCFTVVKLTACNLIWGKRLPAYQTRCLLQAMTVIVRDYKKLTVSEDELKLLLSFVEEDIHDYQRQSTAFPLLKVSSLGARLPRRCKSLVLFCLT